MGAPATTVASIWEILIFEFIFITSWASRVALVVKNPHANAGDIKVVGSIPGLGRSPGGRHSNPLQYSSLENPMDRRAWQTTVYRVTKSRAWLRWLSTQHSSHLSLCSLEAEPEARFWGHLINWFIQEGMEGILPLFIREERMLKSERKKVKHGRSPDLIHRELWSIKTSQKCAHHEGRRPDFCGWEDVCVGGRCGQGHNLEVGAAPISWKGNC